MIQHRSEKQAALLLISLINITFVEIVNFMERSLKFSLKCTCQDTNGEGVGYLQRPLSGDTPGTDPTSPCVSMVCSCRQCHVGFRGTISWCPWLLDLSPGMNIFTLSTPR